MKLNIFWHELKYYKRSMLIWIITLCAITMVFLSMYNSLSAQIDSFRQIISNYPKALLTVINFRFEMFYSIYGYLAYLMTFIWLAGAIQAANLGVSVVSKESAGKTADFLLSKPVGRGSVLVQKLLAVLSVLIITNIAYSFFAVLTARLTSPNTFNLKLCLLITLSLFFVQLFFLFIGFLLGTVIPKIKSVISVSMPLVFGLFILSSFSAILDKPEYYYFSAFKYFDSYYIFQNGHYEYKYLWTLLGLAVFCSLLSYVVYRNKDIEQ